MLERTDASIMITRYPYEEPYHLNIEIEATNGRIKGLLNFYINASDLFELADELEVFPRHSSAVYLWELGTGGPFYGRLTALMVRTDHHSSG